jgi:hypothetical protein
MVYLDFFPACSIDKAFSMRAVLVAGRLALFIHCT